MNKTIRIHYAGGTFKEFVNQSPADLARVAANSTVEIRKAIEIVGETDIYNIVPLGALSAWPTPRPLTAYDRIPIQDLKDAYIAYLEQANLPSYAVKFRQSSIDHQEFIIRHWIDGGYAIFLFDDGDNSGWKFQRGNYVTLVP